MTRFFGRREASDGSPAVAAGQPPRGEADFAEVAFGGLLLHAQRDAFSHHNNRDLSACLPLGTNSPSALPTPPIAWPSSSPGAIRISPTSRCAPSMSSRHGLERRTWWSSP